MTACVNCSRALQPAWKYCIFCGTRTAVAAAAPRSRPLPKRTPVPGYASVSTVQTPIVPPDAPAPLSAAPSEEPVSSVWPETMGERPSLRSAIAATEVPAPTPPLQDAPAPDGEELPDEPIEPDESVEPDEPIDDGSLDDEPARALSIADLVDAEPEPEPETRRSRRVRRVAGSTALLEAAPAAEPEIDAADDDEYAVDEEPRRGVNTLAVLALLIGILACPVAALFGHLALGQLKVSNERGVIPAWIAVVLGYLWLGFWIVFGITYVATNGG